MVVQTVAVVHVVNVELACNQRATQLVTIREIDFITIFQLIQRQVMFDLVIMTQENVNVSLPNGKNVKW